MSDEVPEGWTQTRLSTVIAGSFYGPRFASGDYAESGTPTIRTTDMDVRGRISLREPPRVRVEASEMEKFGLRDGDLLVTRTGTIGRCALYTAEVGPAIPSAYLIRFRLRRELAEPRFVLQFLLSPLGQQQFGLGTTAVAQPNINAKTIGDFLFPLPTLAEQRRIVAKVEALLAQVNAARERLETVPLLMKRFRQSVLARAFRGELVPTEAELAEREGRSFQSALELLGQGSEDVGDNLPQGWASTKFGALLQELRNGLSPRPAIEPPGVPVLRISAVRPGLVSLDDVRYLPRGDEYLTTFGLRDGDLLFTRYNGSLDLVGVCGLVRGLNGRPRLYPDKLMRVRLRDGVVLPEYVEQFFQSPQARGAVTAIARSSAGQQGISGGDLKEQLVPIPPLPEQRRIVARVAALLAAAASVEAEAERQLRVVDRAPPAILQRAFAGELVPTEAELSAAEGREFESAEKLLGRLNSRLPGGPQEAGEPRRQRSPRAKQAARSA